MVNHFINDILALRRNLYEDTQNQRVYRFKDILEYPPSSGKVGFKVEDVRSREENYLDLQEMFALRRVTRKRRLELGL